MQSRVRHPSHLSAVIFLSLSAALATTAQTTATTTSPAGRPGNVLAALKLYVSTFKPVPGETSLLAYATREQLDWTAIQNLFQTQVNAPSGQYAEWRGHNATAAGSVFTTLRAATYPPQQPGQKALLVVNREWCAGGSCQTRTSFAWISGSGSPQTLKLAPEASLIPLLRDQDFYPGQVPACLRGVSLGVSYVPLRSGTSLSALAVIPQGAQQQCAKAGVSTDNLTRPLRLQWHPEVGLFRRPW